VHPIPNSRVELDEDRTPMLDGKHDRDCVGLCQRIDRWRSFKWPHSKSSKLASRSISMTSKRSLSRARLVNDVSVGPVSQALPWHFDGKAATARAAATKVIKSSGAKVYVSSRPDMPGVLLFSRVPLTGRQGQGKANGR
jgi:hypothetical protein